MTGKIWTSQELQFLKDNYNSDPDKMIVSLGRTQKAIKNKAQRLGITRCRVPGLDHQYFTILNKENCYWAGFIAADGSLPIGRQQVVINLASCDKRHLEYFKQCLKFKGQIYNYYDSVRLLIPSVQIYHDLQDNFNITPQKSLTLQSPSIQNEDLVRSFIRGYFDGDGCFSTSVSFAGTHNFLHWIREQLSEYVNTNSSQTLRSVGNICVLEYGGRFQMTRILDWLYQDSNPRTRLGRKYDKRMESALLA